jgi:hypothetical protein
MDPIESQINERFAVFAPEGGDTTPLYEALAILEAAERETPPGDPAARRQAIARRLRFLAALDRYLDPRFDPADKPVVGAPPPPGYSGVVYPSGEVDPAAIADPAARAEYERARRQSQAYARWYDVQDQLRRIDERATHFLELLLRERYTDAPADRAEFEALLAASPLDETRRETVRALLPPALE